jgi:hypothetical protein
MDNNYMVSGRCWVEVYDKHPFDKTAVRLRCGYISEAGDTLEQLCALLPLEEWDELLCCSPGKYSCSTSIFDIDHNHANERTRAKSRLAKDGFLHKWIFHGKSQVRGIQQLVIVRRSK